MQYYQNYYSQNIHYILSETKRRISRNNSKTIESQLRH